MYRGIFEKFYGVERMETDVVVVGGSGAGVSASVAAARLGLRVILVSKGKVGRSGNAIVSTANIAMDGESAYAMGERRAKKTFTRDMLFERIVRFSFYLADPRLVSYFVEDCGKRVGDFVRTGRHIGEPFIFIPPSGWITTGASVGRILLRMLKGTTGVDTLEDTMVVDVLLDRDERKKRVAGVLALGIKTGKLFVIKARAVVIASGGYQPYSFRCTTSDTTGDGIAMALRIGASVSDMEFQLFLPGVMRYPPRHRGSIFPFLWYVGGFVRPDIVNSHGESVVEKIDPRLFDISMNTKWFKLIHAYYWAREIEGEDRGGGLFFDFRGVGKLRYALSVMRERFMLKMLYGKPWVYQGEDFKDLHRMVKDALPWAVGLSSEYSMGGVVVDERLQSEIDGLFVAGESASGLFGAFRGENGLTEMLVMGYRGGEYAGRYAMEADDVSVDNEYLESRVAGFLLPFEGGGNRGNIFRLREDLETIADMGFAFLRDEGGISEALGKLGVLYEKLKEISFLKNNLRGYNPEFLEYLQLRNLITCLTAGLKAAYVRRESRGMHVRRDYPEVNHYEWLKRIRVFLSDVSVDNEGIERFSVTSIDMRGLYEAMGIPGSVLPTGRDRNILEYIEKRGIEGGSKNF